jgi:Do/DeqQ family serine protease
MKIRLGIILLVIVTALAGAMTGTLITFRYMEGTATYIPPLTNENHPVRLERRSGAALTDLPFEEVSRKVTPAVVHIRATFGAGSFSLNPLDRYFSPETRSSGSGVIVSSDGYIITNYHVIEGSSRLEAILPNNQRFYAKVIGTDPSTDLALLKVKARNLPYVPYGISDDVNPGEWVLAVGNPFDLNSTVTAGIVSAKARNIGILRDRNNLQVEAFIQTDAAVNPGNSGGALVNLEGELIGINSAIATNTGTYAGYSFAIPIDLVRKVVEDLIEFGSVQRGLLGVRIRDVDAELADQQELSVVQGVFVTDVNAGSAADDAGMFPGDVITHIDGYPVPTVSELQERVARLRPGNKVNVTFIRQGQPDHRQLVLKTLSGDEETSEAEVQYDIEGVRFEDLSAGELERLNISYGVRAADIREGKWKKAGFTAGLILTHIDKLPVESVEDLNRILKYKSGGILIEGLSAEGRPQVFAADW